MNEAWDVVVVGSSNAGLCAAIAAREAGCNVLVIEKADPELAGGNSKYTAGAMRFVYEGNADLLPLLQNPDDPRLPATEFGAYTADRFAADLLHFNDGRPLSPEQEALIAGSYDTLSWLASHDVKFEPIYSRQSFEKDGKHVFWGGLTLAAEAEGVGLVEAELRTLLRMGGSIRYDCAAVELLTQEGRVTGVKTETARGEGEAIRAPAVILACGGFRIKRRISPALSRRRLGQGQGPRHPSQHRRRA